MTAQANGDNLRTGAAFAILGFLLLTAGGVLSVLHPSAAGCGSLLLIWGLASLVGALSRWVEPRVQ